MQSIITSIAPTAGQRWMEVENVTDKELIAALRRQKEESMALMTKNDSAPAEKTGKAVTVETLFDLLRGAVDAGYGEAPVTVEGCRFAEMHLRVELMMTNSLRLGGEPVAVELQGTPETAGKE